MDWTYLHSQTVQCAVRLVGRKRTRSRSTRPRLSAEPLEPRMMLSSTYVSLAGTAATDSFTVKLDAAGANVEFFRDVPTSGLPTLSVPTGDLTGVYLDGRGGGDSFTIDYTNGDPIVSPFTIYAPPASSTVALNNFTVIDPAGASLSSDSDGTLSISDDNGVDDSISASNIGPMTVQTADQSSVLTIDPLVSAIDANAGAHVTVSSASGVRTMVTDDFGESLNVSTGSLSSPVIDVGIGGEVTVDYSSGDPIPGGGVVINAGRINVTGAGGSSLNTSAGSAIFSDASISGSAMTFPATSRLTLTGADPTDHLTAISGFVYVSADEAGQGPSVNIAAGATVDFSGSVSIPTLTAQPGGLARVVQDGSSVLTVATLDLEPATTDMPGGILDLADNDLIVTGDDVNAAGGSDGTLQQVTGWIAAGYDNGTFDGVTYDGPTQAAIVSVVSAKITDSFTAIGVLGVSDAGLLKPGLFDGTSVVDGDVVCRYTYAGDVNLDGIANEDDWTRVNNDQNQPGGWEQGDLNYDGTVSDNDLYLVTGSEWSANSALPPAVEGHPYILNLPGDSQAEDTQGYGAVPVVYQSWTIDFGDGSPLQTVTPDPATGQFDPVMHNYGSNEAGMYDVSMRASAVELNTGIDVTVVRPHQDLIVNPLAPTGLTATLTTGAGATSIDLSWTNNGTMSTGDIAILMSTDGTNFYPFDTVGPATDDYTATGLDGGTQYWFEVQTDGGRAVSAVSGPASATTDFVPPDLEVQGTGTVVEGQPYELDLTGTFAIDEPDSIADWVVDWGDGCAPVTYAALSDATVSLSVFHNFSAGAATPTPVVTAIDAAGVSFTATADMAEVTPLPPVFSSATFSGNSITVHWTNRSSIVTDTEVVLSSDQTGTTALAGADADATSTSMTIGDLDLDTDYWVSLTATDGVGGFSDPTTPYEVSLPYVPATLVLTALAPATESGGYGLNLGADYAEGTPQGDLITSWQVDWGDGHGDQTYTGQAVTESGQYAASATGATVQITANDGNGHTYNQTQPVVFSPNMPTDLSVSANSNYSSARVSFTAVTNQAGVRYVVERFDPVADSWTPIGTVSSPFYGSPRALAYIDTGPGGAGLRPGGVGGGYLYRVAGQGSAVTATNPGSAGLSAYTPAVLLADSSGGPRPGGVDAVWTPDNDIGETTFLESKEFNTSVTLPAHMGYQLVVGIGGAFGPGSTATLAGSNGINQTLPMYTNGSGGGSFNYTFTDQDTVTTISLTLTVNITRPGLDGYWVGDAYFTDLPGQLLRVVQSLQTPSVTVGAIGTMTVAYAGTPVVAGLTLNAVSSDPSILQVLTGSMTTDANGDAQFQVQGDAAGTAYLIVSDAAGGKAIQSFNVYAAQPTLTLTATDTGFSTTAMANSSDGSATDFYVAEDSGNGAKNQGSGQVTLKLTAKDSDGQQIRWNISSGTGASPADGQFGDKPSELVLTPGDHDYVVTATEGAAPNAVTATINVHVLDVTVAKESAGNSPGENLKKADQDSTGVYLPWDTLDEDYNGTPDYVDIRSARTVPGDSEMVKVVLHAVGGSAKGNYKLATVPTNIAVFKSPDGSNPVTSSTAIDASSDTTLYVEGIARDRSGTLTVDWSNGTATSVHVDSVKFSTFSWTGPQDVPDNSTYQYNLSGAAKGIWSGVGSGTDDAHPGSLALAKGKDGKDIGTQGLVTWGAGTDVGEVIATINPSFVWQFPVNVVHVDVDLTSPNTRNKIKYVANTTESPAPLQSNAPAIGQTNVSSSPPGSDAMTATVTIGTITGPTVNGTMRGVKWIQIGSLQTATITQDYATYIRTDDPQTEARKTDIGHQDNGSHIDYDTGNPKKTRPSLWYVVSSSPGKTSFFQAVKDQPVAPFTLTTVDRPVLEVAENLHDTYNSHAYSISSANLHVMFNLYVAIATSRPDDPTATGSIQPTGSKGVNTVYTERAMTSWDFDGSGTIGINGVTGTWNRSPSAEVGGSSTYTAVPPATAFSTGSLKDLIPANLLPTTYVWPK